MLHPDWVTTCLAAILSTDLPFKLIFAAVSTPNGSSRISLPTLAASSASFPRSGDPKLATKRSASEMSVIDSRSPIYTPNTFAKQLTTIEQQKTPLLRGVFCWTVRFMQTGICLDRSDRRDLYRNRIRSRRPLGAF